MWYFACFLIGLFLGYAAKDLISPEITIKGKINQKGKGNILSVKPRVNVKEKPRKRLFKRNKKGTS